MFTLLMLILLTSCAAPEAEVTDKGEVAVNQAEKVEEVETPSVQVYNQDVAELVAKGKKRTEYHYAWDYKVRDSFGNYRTEADYEVFVKGDKVKKMYLVPRKLNLELFYDNLYLDKTTRTAFATCVRNSILCRPSYEKVYPADYEELPFTAIDLLEKVPQEAKSVGTRALFGRSALVVEYGNERLYVDTYFGLPLKHEMYKVEEGEEIILEESTFSRLSISVKDSDVNVPKEYLLVE